MVDAGIVVNQWKEPYDVPADELIQICKEHDALISVGQDKIDKNFLTACSHLKVIAQMAVGFDNIDLIEASKLRIPIGNTPGVLSRATADVSFMLMLMVSRMATFMYRKILDGKWGFYDPTANLGVELYGKTLGIYGLGKIGLEMAQKCSNAFGMNIIYHNRNPSLLADRSLGAKFVSFESLLGRSDVLSVHSALTEETKNKFTLECFSKMKPTAIFINTARGSIHNERDLTEALRSKMIWGAGLDVTNPEPMQASNPLLMMPNVVILPHIGSATIETRGEMSRLAAENIIAASRGIKIPYLVNPSAYS